MTWDEEARLVSLVIASMRYGIDRESLIEFLVGNIGSSDPQVRNNCFLRALEINENIEAHHGKSVIPIALITEYVRTHYKSSSNSIGLVLQKYQKMSATETSLLTIGERVSVSEQIGDWVYIERADDDSGWVPKECISFAASLDI